MDRQQQGVTGRQQTGGRQAACRQQETVGRQAYGMRCRQAAAGRDRPAADRRQARGMQTAKKPSAGRITGGAEDRQQQVGRPVADRRHAGSKKPSAGRLTGGAADRQQQGR